MQFLTVDAEAGGDPVAEVDEEKKLMQWQTVEAVANRFLQW